MAVARGRHDRSSPSPLRRRVSLVQDRGLPVFDEQGNIVRWFRLNSDINDVKYSERKGRPAGASLAVTDAIPVGISILAPDGTTLYVNRLALDRIGLTRDEVKGKGHLERSCHPDDLDRILEERRKGLLPGKFHSTWKCVRELQNVVERAVILSDTDIFDVDETG